MNMVFKQFGVAAALAVTLAGSAGIARAAAPDARVTMVAKAAAVGVGYTWGNGTLYFHGKSHEFSVKGVTIADLGYARVVSKGRVFHLKNLHDFDGTYAAVTGEATLGKGFGGQLLRNGNGVEISVDDVSKGARLTAAGDGIQLTLR